MAWQSALMGLRASQDLRQTRDTRNLNRLVSGAYEAPVEQRQSILPELARINAGAAQQYEKQLQSEDDRRRKNIAGLAGGWANVPVEHQEGYYRNFVTPALSANGVQAPEYTAEGAGGYMAQLQAAYGGGGQGRVQSTYVDDQGQRVAIMADGSQKVLGGNDAGMTKRTITINGPDGRPRQYTFDNRTGSYVPADFGGQQPQQLTQFTGPNGEQIRIDPALPQNVQQAIMSDPNAWGQLPDGTRATLPPTQSGPSPFVGRSPEEQAAANEQAKLDVQLANAGRVAAADAEAAGQRESAVQGARTQAERAAQAPKREAQYRQALVAARNVETSIDKALGLIGPMSTGFVGARFRGLEGSPAYNLAAEIETVKANLGFDRLQQMRDNSPTGGALGAIAVQELIALQSTIANLDPNQSAEQIQANLQRVKTHYANWRSAVEQALADEGRGVSQASPANNADEALIGKYL